jgi:predicted metalloprotease
VLFSGSTTSGCGSASSSTGPFYCPADSKVYIDLSFYSELMEAKFGASGDFAQAYVVAHEVGHHVQNLLGIAGQVRAMEQSVSEREANALSVRMELQADFFAGVWAHWANKRRQILEPGDIEEAIRAAAAVGDDRLQKMSRGTVMPDSFTHGTSEQRMRWFKMGFESGDINMGNTFAAENP